MTIDFVSPGTTGRRRSQTVPVPINDDAGADLSVLRPHFFPRDVLKSGHRQVFRPKVGKGIHMTVTVRGANIVAHHAQAVEALIPGAVWTIQNTTGVFMTNSARRLMDNQAIWLTGDTYRSIHHFLTTTPNSVTVSVGPTTFYAPFIEYGLGGHINIGPRPFMTDSMFQVIPHWRAAFKQLAAIVAAGAKGGPITENPYATPLNSFIARYRKYLYTVEKEIGDIVPLGVGGVAGLQRFRGGLLAQARVLGDVQAVMGRVVGQRFARRLTGKVTGRLIGVGSRTVFVNKSYTSSITGGQRVYNRFAGRAVTKYVDQGALGRSLSN